MIAWFNHTFPNVVYLGWGGDTGWGTAISQTLYMTFFFSVNWWTYRFDFRNWCCRYS